MKKCFKIINLIVGTILICDTIYSKNFESLIKELEKKDATITKIKADYKQTINIVDLNQTYVIDSEFIFVFPDKLRIEITNPFKQSIVVNNKKLFIKNANEDIIYTTNVEKYFSNNINIFPLIFSKDQRYNLSELVKKTGLKFVTEEDNYYVLSTRYAKGKVYKDKKVGLREGETRFIMWIDKQTLFPKKVDMISEKYIIETELKNYSTDFEVEDEYFDIKKSSETKIVELK
ncbi:MAG: outer-membrane lipoprotein carrier protein LolA [Endomicrobiia bacterium]